MKPTALLQLVLAAAAVTTVAAFRPLSASALSRRHLRLHMAMGEPEESPTAPVASAKEGPTPIAKEGPTPMAKEGPTPMAASTSVSQEEENLTEEQVKARQLREAETFMVRQTGDMECELCGYLYKEDEGDNRRIPPGTPWEGVPDNWRCPDCGAPKAGFVPSTITIPGFEVNQGYGFGGNGLTGDQKTTLIFGGLAVFFLIFMSGYLLE